MNEHKLQLYHEERAKDLYREAQNERLARSVPKDENVLKNARKALGRGLVSVGQNLLNQS